MNCPDCSKKLRGKKEKIDYSKSSFEGVFIEAKIYRCKPCDVELIDHGDYQETNLAICEYLIQPDFLNRKHIKFIMEQVLCINIFEFAKMIKCHPQFINDLIRYRAILSKDMKDRIIKQIIYKLKQPTIELVS